MRILHTSDWHLGRQLHGLDQSGAQEAFVEHLVSVVRAERVDAVLVSGDVHDRALAPVGAMELFTTALEQLRDAGATVVAISGNHDAPLRLGDRSRLMDPRVRILTDPRRVGEPVLVGDVAIYGIPYLEPAVVADSLPGEAGEESGAHTRVLGQALRAVRADVASRGLPSVVLAHAWVAGGEASESERELGVGGVARVPVSLFDGIDYAALGHLHGPQVLAEGLRYSGSPLPYSLSEAGHEKGSWLLEIGPDGLGRVEKVPAPVWKRLSTLRGTLEDLLSSREFDGRESDIVFATLTDAVRPTDAMARLQRRFPTAVSLSFEPLGVTADGLSYAARTRGRSDVEIALNFLAHVRGEVGDRERSVVAEALEAVRAAEAVAVASGAAR